MINNVNVVCDKNTGEKYNSEELNRTVYFHSTVF